MRQRNTLRIWFAGLFALVGWLALATPGLVEHAYAQNAPGESGPDSGADLADELADEVLADPPEGEDTTDQEATDQDEAAGADTDSTSVPYLELLLEGGWMMIPILLMSIVVIVFAVERSLALRRSRVMPKPLIDGLGDLAARGDKFDPRKAYRLCQMFPSTAATVIRTMLLKVGRPQSEIEHAVIEASEREADRLYSNVRTLNLAAAVTPLLGLLGTVLGMIQAFFVTANMEEKANKAEQLASGIYVALVTTFAGLAVAIPAAVFAHLLEGRIQSLLRDIDDLLFNLLPQVERYEGKLRVSREQLGESRQSVDTEVVQQERETASAK